MLVVLLTAANVADPICVLYGLEARAADMASYTTGSPLPNELCCLSTQLIP